MNRPALQSERLSVLLPRPFDHGFDYLVPPGVQLAVGDMVRVPFGKSPLTGVVWGTGAGDIPLSRCKPITERVLGVPPLKPSMRQFIEWVAWYTLAPLGMVLKMALPPRGSPSASAQQLVWRGSLEGLSATRQRVFEALCAGPAPSIVALAKRAGVSPSVVSSLIASGHVIKEAAPALAPAARTPQVPTLSPEQREAAQHLAALADDRFAVCLLEGVTGSGKTEVYFDRIARTLAQGRQVLVLLPEIALSVQWMQRCEARFGIAPVVWHSGVSPAARHRAWHAVANGRAQLVVGARSALFLPFADLGLTVVDEEHDSSYKQEDGVLYQARDMAIARARIEQRPIILASATPSLETLHNVQQGKYQHVRLSARFGAAALPQVEVIDLRAQQLSSTSWISAPLKDAMVETLAAGHQVLLFLNRRGYAPLVLCRACGHRFQCPSCTAWMVLHQRRMRLECHHCGHTQPIPSACPACKAEGKLAACGPGVERVEEEVSALFPDARVVTITSESHAQENLASVISGMTERRIDILIGTQLIAKGHHFPSLALVGVIDGDLGLSGGDLRAGERTYQLLHQLAGRAGRERAAGRALIQTYLPQHPVMQALKSASWQALMKLEEAQREAALLPPYGRLAAIVMDGPSEPEVLRAMRALAQAAPHHPDLQVLGPAPAPLARLKNRFRYRLLVKTARQVNLQAVLRDWLKQAQTQGNLRCRVDVDPYSFL